MVKKILKDTLVLCVITFIAGLMLGAVEYITREPIAQAKIEAKNKAYKEVFEEADEFKGNEELDNALIAPSMTLQFSINEYVEHFGRYDQMKCADLARDKGIQKTAFLIM